MWRLCGETISESLGGGGGGGATHFIMMTAGGRGFSDGANKLPRDQQPGHGTTRAHLGISPRWVPPIQYWPRMDTGFQKGEREVR